MSIFVRPGLVGAVGIPGRGVMVHVMFYVVLRIVDDFIVHHLGFRELKDYHST